MKKVRKHPGEAGSIHVVLTAQEFMIPPIRDCLIVGRKSPVGYIALKKALSLLHGEPFEDLHPNHKVIRNILIRENILRRIPREKLTALILKRIAPLMGEDEVLRVDLELEVVLEDQV